MCIQTCALFLVGVKNIQVGLIKSGMWMQKNPNLDLSLASLDIHDSGGEGGSGVGTSSRRLSSSIEQASCSIFVDEMKMRWICMRP